MKKPRILFIIPHVSYRAEDFLKAAERLGVEVFLGSDRCQKLGEVWHDDTLLLDFNDVRKAARAIVAFVQDCPVDAVLGADDKTALIASLASADLSLPHNSVEAVSAAHDKYKMRELLSQQKIPCPNFKLLSVDDPYEEAANQATYPCVLKPVSMSASRGVIRADTPDQFINAFERIRILLETPEFSTNSDEASRQIAATQRHHILVETFISGKEVALEGILINGSLRVLALFDKPDPLDGPFFEETIYVTPSRLPLSIQDEISACTSRAAKAMGLLEGPVHAELRINEQGLWLIELAARSIGGLCSRTLQFGTGMSLEELVIRHALGMEIITTDRENGAAGVMMMPVPCHGILQEVEGIEDAESVPGIWQVAVTAKQNHEVIPLPEGSSYLGFIFARGETPQFVENALRAAFGKLKIAVAPLLPTVKAAPE